jgi:hypothetical protein
LPKVTEYLDPDIASRLTAEDKKEIINIIRNYYTLKEMECGVGETEILTMLFIDYLSVEEVSARINLSARQVRRRRAKYLNFIIKVIYNYLENKDLRSSILP